MIIQHSLTAILKDHVTLELESIDRMYLNVYVPRLQTEAGVACFFKKHRGATFASSALMEPMSNAFRKAIDAFAERGQVPFITFAKGQRKDDLAKEYLAKSDGKEGVLFVGKAQEKARAFRTEKRRYADSDKVYPWIVRSTAMVNHYYFYCVDADFGPFFVKYCGYFPYTAKLCINGHEYLKRQLQKEGIGFEALDNGILCCENPARMQEIADALSAEKISDLLHKWQLLLPFPFAQEDTAAGYQYQISIYQAEFSLTQVLDRPLTGRQFFETVIRENLDIGRPDQVQLIFERRITKRTPGRFRTRIITEGVTPSLHAYYKYTGIKQYHKEHRALRTETTINNTRDFNIGKSLLNLPALRIIGFSANRRLLDVQRLSHDCFVGHEALQKAQEPKVEANQRTSGLRFGDFKTHVLLQSLLIFQLQVYGFSNRDLREQLAALLHMDMAELTPGRMTYLLRKVRMHRLIARIPKSHRYRLTEFGLRLSLFYTRAYNRLLEPAAARVLAEPSEPPEKSRDSIDRLGAAMDACCRAFHLAA
ncbi:MAG: hypothetical protein M3Y27_14220 [Acidobacteriota bacterium]|nr:hypothetical protein [Acidobacteriota bacterium]